MIDTHFSFLFIGGGDCSLFAPAPILIQDVLQVSPPLPGLTQVTCVHKVLTVHHPAGNVLLSSSEEPEAEKLCWDLEFSDTIASCPGTWRLLDSRLLASNSQHPLF